MPRAPDTSRQQRSDLLETNLIEAPKAPKIPDDVIDEMLAELREAENVAHE